VILPPGRADWPEAAREELEERAAILQFEANLPREEAERKAEELVRAAWGPLAPGGQGS
jgi:hypothetical protein